MAAASMTGTRQRLTRRAVLAGGLAMGATVIGPRHRAAADFPQLAKLRPTMIVGSEVGGGYDLCGRTLARHLERTVPGLRVDVKNVPQASGKLGAKMLQEGPTDGGLLFTSTPGLLSSQVLGEDGVAFDLATWSWLGKVAGETRFLVSGPGADFKNLEELRAKKTSSPLSVRSKSSYVYHEALWINALLGTRIKPIPGYKAVEKDAALLSGEVMLTIQTYPTDRKIMESPGLDVTLRVTDGETPDTFKDRPLLSQMLGDRPDLEPVLRFMTASANLLRWFALPPKTDPAILAEWRAAFDATVASPDFISDAGKLDFKVEPLTGREVAQAIGDVLSGQKALNAQLTASLACGEALAEGAEGSCGHV